MIDIVVTQPDSTDFPVWRDMISRIRSHIRHISVCISPCNLDLNITTYLSQTLLDMNCIVTVAKNNFSRDWRDISTNLAIDALPNKDGKILFIEQDFIVYNTNKLLKVLELDSDIVHMETKVPVESQTRYHPAFFLINKDILYKTKLI